ncbi:MAG: S1 RNA-binding domain-containing protein [Anaerolineales bacterium]|nr:S1 RNA-binding domain-containing protein [Anaerolineales bacterium]
MEHNEVTFGEEILPEKEVEEREEHPMEALLQAEAYELKTPQRGEIKTGTIARITDSEILVDIGAKSEGVIPSRELEQLSDEQRAEMVVGKELDVYIVRSSGRDGSMLLSISRAREEQDWKEVESLQESREIYEGTISGYNKGGLIVKFGHLRGFIPASQVSISRRRRSEGETPDQRWGEMVGEPIVAKVIEVDRRRNRLILSERAASRESRDALKEKLITELESGEERTGTVISLADFGVFVDIGGADGLVHISELSWRRVAHPKELVQVGQEVKVKILGVDPDRKRISLSMREMEPNPWNEIMEGFQEGQLVEGTITKLTKFGAFASLAGAEEFEIEGLIHISELSDQRVEHPREVVQEGQILTLRLIKIDMDRKRLGLSLKDVASPEFAEIDWQTAVQDIESEEAGQAESPEEIEDFDAALESDATDLPPTDILDDEADDASEGEPTAAASLDDVVEEADPEDVVEEADPEDVIEEADPEDVVEEADPEEVVEEAGPEDVVEEADPEDVIEEADPEDVIEEADPEEVVEEADPGDVVEEADSGEVVEDADSGEVVEEADSGEVVEEADSEEDAPEEIEEEESSADGS